MVPVASRIRSSLVILCVSLAALCAEAAFSQTIILRDLTLVDSVSIARMNIEGVFLDDGRRYAWDTVLQGDVGAGQQIEFDVWKNGVGEFRFRLLQRLRHHDYGSLEEPAIELERIARESGPPGETLFLARCAMVRAAIASNEPERGLLPLVELIVQRKNNPDLKSIAGLAGLNFTADGFCMELLPFWPDRTRAKAEWQKSASRSGSPELSGIDVVRVYFSALSVAAGESETADASLAGENDPWKAIYLAQSALLDGNDPLAAVELDPDQHVESPVRHALALYYSGLASLRTHKAGAITGRDGKLVLLSIPAIYGTQFAELSAAAIHAVITHPSFSADPECELLRAELSGPYRHTTFGIESR
jgi:hypothetical protein